MFKCKIPSCQEECQYNKHRKRFANFCKRHNKGVTLEKFTVLHGELEGSRRFKSYCDKQALTNTFEYKKEKYGWTKEQFDSYNQSRAVTLPNLIARHGEEIGRKKFSDYVARQAIAGCSLEYFQEKYGENEGLEFYKALNEKKRLNLTTFINKYGEVDGVTKFEEFCSGKSSSFFSKESVDFFNKLVSDLEIDAIFGGKEFGMMDTETKRYYKYDFKYKNIIIEYHGLAFHPRKPTDYFRNPFDKKQTAEEAYNRDQAKRRVAESRGFFYLEIWNDTPFGDRIELCKSFILTNLKT